MQGTAFQPNVFDRLANAWRGLKAQPAPAQLYPTQQSIQGGFLTFPGWEYLQNHATQQHADERNAKLATASPWVFRDISAIAREASVATLDVKQRAAGADEDVENHPLEILWENPNPFMGRAWLLQWWIWQLLLYGEAYLYVVTDATGQPAEIWPLPSLYLTPVPDDKKFIAAYLWKKPGASAGIKIDTRPVIYSRLPNPFDIRRGLSPLCAALVEIEGDQAMARWNKNFFSKENATPTGLIAMPKDSLDADVARVRMEIQEFFGGNGTRRVAVARAGDLAWTPFDRSQKDMEFLNARTFNQKLIDTIFGIPEGFWSKDATRANSEGAKATMIENAVWPHLVMLAEDLNAQLLPAYYEAGLRAEFADIRPRNRTLELAEFKTYQTVLPVERLLKLIDQKPLGDVRDKMLISEINKGTPLPTTPAAQEIEEYIAEQEAMVEEEAPAEGTPPMDEAPVEGGPIEAVKGWAVKHGKHDQSTHGRRTGRRMAYRAAYASARASGASPIEARAAGRAAGLEHRDKERAERRAPAPNTEGTTTRAYGLDPNQSYELQHRLVDMKDIQASNTASGGINPNYDPSLQPRDRSRAASQAQIDQVARQMNPDVLVTDFHRIDAGSPIIDEHGNVLSGNGRTLAMQRAADLYPEQHAAYRARLRAEAEALGIDPRAIDKMENPVLVRQLKGDTDPAAFAREANSSNVLRMSPLEQAKADAVVLNEGHMLKLHVGDGQDIDRALRDKANKPFIDDFMKTVPDNERANLLTRDGDLNQMGLYRMKAAIYTKAFPGSAGERMAESMLESLDPEVKSIQTGISAGLPSFSRATSLARSGQRDRDLDISDDFARVVDVYARIKDNPNLTAGTPANQLVSKYLSQASMFGRDLNPQQERLLVHLDQISRKPTAVRDLLTRYSQIVEGQPQPGQAGMFGNDRMTRAQLYDALLAGSAPAQTQGGLFG